MLIKSGVDISRLNKPIRRSLNTVSSIYEALDKTELVITSTYEGTHAPGSYHYCNDAYDIRLPSGDQSILVKAAAVALGRDYDVILKADHIHIEYDQKG